MKLLSAMQKSARWGHLKFNGSALVSKLKILIISPVLQNAHYKSTGNHGEYDYWIVKLGEEVVGIEEPSANDNVLFIYPNPAHDNFTIRINAEIINAQVEIYNVVGEKVYTSSINNKQETRNNKYETIFSGNLFCSNSCRRNVLHQEINSWITAYHKMYVS